MSVKRALLAVPLVFGACGGDATADLLTRSGTVELTVHHSRFTPSEVQVRAGSEIRFVVRNDDPIDHELIVGDAAVHERHRNGTEPHHGEKPGEVSVAGGSTASTTYRFDTPGEVVFACHLPGHFDYGMRGVVRVLNSKPSPALSTSAHQPTSALLRPLGHGRLGRSAGGSLLALRG